MAQMKPTVKKGNLKSSTKKTEKDPKRKLKLAPERAPEPEPEDGPELEAATPEQSAASARVFLDAAPCQKRVYTEHNHLCVNCEPPAPQVVAYVDKALALRDARAGMTQVFPLQCGPRSERQQHGKPTAHAPSPTA